MNKTTKYIIIISSVVAVLGVGTYLYLKRRNRRNVTKRSEKIAGREVKDWDELKANLPNYLPSPEIKFADAREISADEKVSDKVFPYNMWATLKEDGKTPVNMLIIYYYSDGDFRIYESVDNGKKFLWIASGKWVSPNGTSVNIEPKDDGKKFNIEKGNYSGDSVQLMMNKIFGRPIGYYNAKTKLFEV